jgi:DNA replication protein DnaC
LSFPSIAGTLPAIEFTIIRSRSRAGTTSAEALLDRLTHHVHILEMNGESYRLRQSKHRRRSPSSDAS